MIFKSDTAGDRQKIRNGESTNILSHMYIASNTIWNQQKAKEK